MREVWLRRVLRIEVLLFRLVVRVDDIRRHLRIKLGLFDDFLLEARKQ